MKCSKLSELSIVTLVDCHLLSFNDTFSVSYYPKQSSLMLE